MRGDERAVSDVVAFVLVFAIIIGSVGLISVTAFSSMEGLQESEQMRNAERGMGALADNFNDVLRYDAIEERSGELSLREGTVRTGSDGASINVTVWDNGGDRITSNETSLGQFTYERGGTTIAYEGGGVFRGEDSGDVLLERPRMKCEDDGAAVVSLVAIDADDRSLQSHDGQEFTVIEERDHENRTVETHTENVGKVNVTVENTDFENGWESTLSRGDWEWDDEENTGTCEADRATIRIVVVDLEF
ncbi:DUF7289 family protein [Natrialbaceae archaeon A-gly3]